VIRAVRLSDSHDVVTEIRRQGAREMLAKTIESEIANWIEVHACLLEAGRRQVVRNGSHPERAILTGLEPLAFDASWILYASTPPAIGMILSLTEGVRRCHFAMNSRSATQSRHHSDSPWVYFSQVASKQTLVSNGPRVQFPPLLSGESGNHYQHSEPLWFAARPPAFLVLRDGTSRETSPTNPGLEVVL
jgi:hypothetical protein